MARKKREEKKAPEKKTDAGAKLQAIKMAMDQIEKQYGTGSIMKLGQSDQRAKVEFVSTGSIALDIALGVGGLPRGRIVEIYGPEASGKTTVAISVIAEAQKAGGQCAFVDAEHALDPERAELIGVDLDELLLSQPDSGEQALQIVETLVESGKIDTVVIDSVAALVPKAEISGEMGDFQIGLQARLMSQALRKLTGMISKTKTSVIFINQTRMKIGSFFGNPTTTSGGLALKFYSSVRINLARIAQIKQKDKIIGSRIRAKIVKNKVAAPFKNVEFDIYYNEGISYVGDIINTGIVRNVLSRKGSWYWFKDKQLGQGMEKTRELLSGDNKMLEEIKKAILESEE